MSDGSQSQIVSPALQQMGVGSVDDNAADLQQQNQAVADADAAMLAELTEMFNAGDGADIEAVEARSRYTEDGVRPDPTSEGGEGEGTGGNEAQSTVTDQPLTDPDDPIPGLPPTGFENNGVQPTAPGDGGAAGNGSPPSGHQPPTIDLNQLAEHIYGERPDEVTARAILQMARDMRNLTPVQVAQMQQVINGPQYTAPQPYPSQVQYTPDPYTQAQQAQQRPVQQQTPQIQLPEHIDPELNEALQPFAQLMQAQQAELEQMRQQQFEQRQAQFQQEQIQLRQTMNATAEAWKDEKVNGQILTPEEWLGLEQEAINSGMLPALVQAGIDPTQAVNQVLNMQFSQHPEFVARMVQADPQTQHQQQQRRQTSTALSGGGSAIAPTTNGQTATAQPKAVADMTPDERERSMVDELSSILGVGRKRQ